MSAILFLLTGGYLLWIAAYLFHERNSRRKKAEKAGQILTRMAVDVSEILGKSTFSLSHSTPQTPEKIENEKSVSEADTFAPEKEKYPKTVSAEELDKLFAEGSPLPEELELMEDMDVPLEFRKEPADDNPPIDDDEQDRRLPGCTPQATGIRFEDMGLAVRVAVSGEAASEEERIQAGKTLAELRNTPMFEQLTSGDAEREERIGSLIELHLAAYRKRKQPDSEHSAIFQCLQGNRREQLNKIILTASGGPFFGKTRAELENVTVADALNHPNWSMGNKITIDSATLMNKGLEFIEAKWLFDLTPDQIEIVVHRQSVVHSAVEYQDCSVIAQLGVPDMKIPIQYALLYPERMPCPTKHLSLTDYGTLTFEKPDMETFTCLKTAIAAITAGGTAPCIVNGANEVAVAAFLAGKIGFLEIGALAQQAMESIPATVIKTYEDVMKADTQAREFVRNAIA